MEEVEDRVSKHLLNFCKRLPVHVENWKTILDQAAKPVQSLIKLCEQLRCVEKVKLDPSLEGHRSELLFRISNVVEEEIEMLNELVDKLQKTNSDLRNKLFVLEKSSADLDWDDEDSVLIKGNWSQPRLERVLEMGLEFFMFFSKKTNDMSASMRNFDVKNEKLSEQLKVFDVDLNVNEVCYLVALTQYVANEQAIS